MRMNSLAWLLVAAFSVLLGASACAPVRDYYKDHFTSNAPYHDRVHAEAEQPRKAAPQVPQPLDNQDPRTAPNSSPFGFTWRW